MNIGFLGLGKLGLPCALAIESKGHSVKGSDINSKVKHYIKSRDIPYKEDQVPELLQNTKIEVISVKELVELIIKKWGYGNVVIKKDTSKPEAGLLYLDCTKSKTQLGWKPKLDIRETINNIVEWYKNYENEDVYTLCAKQIKEYEDLNND